MSQRGKRQQKTPLQHHAQRWYTTRIFLALTLTICFTPVFSLLAQDLPTPTPQSKTVTLRVGGVERQVTTVKSTVRTLLHQEFISLKPLDRCEPGLNSPVQDGMTVVVTRVTVERVPVRVAVPPVTLTRWIPRMSAEPTIIQQGRPGVVLQVWTVWKKDGVISTQWISATRRLVAPVPTIIARGSLPSRSGMNIRRVLTMRSTAYTPYDAGCNGHTANGMHAGYGVVAVDPHIIPLGTRLYVDGYGPAIAADTGGAIKGNIIDVCFSTKREAYRWGRRTVKVLILE